MERESSEMDDANLEVARDWAQRVIHDTGLGIIGEAQSNAASVLLRQAAKIEELRGLLLVEQQYSAVLVAEITRLRNHTDATPAERG